MQPHAPPSPISVYGRQKVPAEAALKERMAAGAPIAILRLAKVIGPAMPLIHDWIGALRADKSIRTFHDMTLAPTVCDAIRNLLTDRARGISNSRDRATRPISRSADFWQGNLARTKAWYNPSAPCQQACRSGQPRATPHSNSSALRDRYGIVVPDIWDVIGAVVRSR